MDQQRLDFHSKLEEVTGLKAYFQPPESKRIVYPCIVYNVTAINLIHADDTKYIKKRRYEVTVIDRDPDSLYYQKLIDAFDYVSWNRFFINDGLNHWALTIFY